MTRSKALQRTMRSGSQVRKLVSAGLLVFTIGVGAAAGDEYDDKESELRELRQRIG